MTTQNDGLFSFRLHTMWVKRPLYIQQYKKNFAKSWLAKWKTGYWFVHSSKTNVTVMPENCNTYQITQWDTCTAKSGNKCFYNKYYNNI